MATQAEVLLIAPELSGMSAGAFTYFLEQANAMLDPTTFGINYSLATNYLAAHLMTLARNTGGGVISPSGGATTSESAGRVSVGSTLFASVIKDAKRYDLTKYGMMLMTLAVSNGNSVCAMVV